MAILDKLGAAITTGDVIALAVVKNARTPVLLHGTIVDAIQVDNGQRYFHMADADVNVPWARAIITGGTSASTGTCLNAIKLS